MIISFIVSAEWVETFFFITPKHQFVVFMYISLVESNVEILGVIGDKPVENT